MWKWYFVPSIWNQFQKWQKQQFFPKCEKLHSITQKVLAILLRQSFKIHMLKTHFEIVAFSLRVLTRSCFVGICFYYIEEAHVQYAIPITVMVLYYNYHIRFSQLALRHMPFSVAKDYILYLELRHYPYPLYSIKKNVVLIFNLFILD